VFETFFNTWVFSPPMGFFLGLVALATQGYINCLFSSPTPRWSVKNVAQLAVFVQTIFMPFPIPDSSHFFLLTQSPGGPLFVQPPCLTSSCLYPPCKTLLFRLHIVFFVDFPRIGAGGIKIDFPVFSLGNSPRHWLFSSAV